MSIERTAVLARSRFRFAISNSFLSVIPASLGGFWLCPHPSLFHRNGIGMGEGERNRPSPIGIHRNWAREKLLEQWIGFLNAFFYGPELYRRTGRDVKSFCG